MFICNFSCLFIFLILQASVIVRGYEKENEDLDSEIDRIVNEYRNYASHKEDKNLESQHKDDIETADTPAKTEEEENSEIIGEPVNTEDQDSSMVSQRHFTPVVHHGKPPLGVPGHDGKLLQEDDGIGNHHDNLNKEIPGYPAGEVVLRDGQHQSVKELIGDNHVLTDQLNGAGDTEVDKDKMTKGKSPPHPTPAHLRLPDHAKKHAASMADVYFLVKNFEKHISVRDNEEVNAEVNNTDKKPPPPPVAHRHTGEKNPKQPVHSGDSKNMFALYAIVAGCSVAGLVGLIFAGVCWYRLQKNVKAASEAGYPAYGVTGPSNERVTSPGDRKLAQSAQMYHYQHQKQQMIAMEKANGEMKNDGSDEDSDEENEEGDYTVYECPGLAPTGEMEVKNPLFSEDMTPATPATPSPAVEQPAKK